MRCYSLLMLFVLCVLRFPLEFIECVLGHSFLPALLRVDQMSCCYRVPELSRTEMFSSSHPELLALIVVLFNLFMIIRNLLSASQSLRSATARSNASWQHPCCHVISLSASVCIALPLPHVCPTFSWKCFRNHGDQSQGEKLKLNLFLTLFSSLCLGPCCNLILSTGTHTHTYTGAQTPAQDCLKAEEEMLFVSHDVVLVWVQLGAGVELHDLIAEKD